jgi:hypothetical protein
MLVRDFAGALGQEPLAGEGCFVAWGGDLGIGEHERGDAGVAPAASPKPNYATHRGVRPRMTEAMFLFEEFKRSLASRQG